MSDGIRFLPTSGKVAVIGGTEADRNRVIREMLRKRRDFRPAEPGILCSSKGSLRKALLSAHASIETVFARPRPDDYAAAWTWPEHMGSPGPKAACEEVLKHGRVLAARRLPINSCMIRAVANDAATRFSLQMNPFPDPLSAGTESLLKGGSRGPFHKTLDLLERCISGEWTELRPGKAATRKAWECLRSRGFMAAAACASATVVDDSCQAPPIDFTGRSLLVASAPAGTYVSRWIDPTWRIVTLPCPDKSTRRILQKVNHGLNGAVAHGAKGLSDMLLVTSEGIWKVPALPPLRRKGRGRPLFRLNGSSQLT